MPALPSFAPRRPLVRATLGWALVLCATGSLRAVPPLPALPAWVERIGAPQAPARAAQFPVSRFGAAADGKTSATAAIQRAIDACALAGGGVVTFTPGHYLTGALFLKSHVHLEVGAGVVLLASQDDSAYPNLPTRVAGIEMAWPAALINVNDQEDVELSGAGMIDGQGEYWWAKYWALRKTYEPRGIRWAADYDCRRVRLIVVWRSHDVRVAGLHLRRSGFWTVQLTYSERITVEGVKITDNAGPSTDGIDVDSSRSVLIQHCDIDNNDDDICLKAGRDTDGLRVNRPTEYVVIRDNICRRGAGVIAFGSETSGGIRHIVAYRNTGIGTSEGLRFKTARTRGGSVEDVLILDTKLRDVPSPFTFTLDWNPQYSYARIPAGLADVPAYWRVLATPVEPPERGWVDFRDITIAGVTATGARQILTAAGMAGKPLGAVDWFDIHAHGQTAGIVQAARHWRMQEVQFGTEDGRPLQELECEAVELPRVTREQGQTPSKAADAQL